MTADLIAPLRALVEQAKRDAETIDGEFGLGRSYSSLLTEGDADAQKIQAAERAIDALTALIPEPPTGDERQAITLIVRDVHNYDGRPGFLSLSGADARRIAEAILASPVWRNRGRGPITEDVIQKACRAHHIAVWGDDLDPEHIFPAAEVAAMRAAFEAAPSLEPIIEALRDLAENGLRFDLNPTMAITTADEVYAQWSSYARRMDASARASARAALERVLGTEATRPDFATRVDAAARLLCEESTERRGDPCDQCIGRTNAMLRAADRA